MLEITLQQAKRLFLKQQGLSDFEPFGRGINATKKVIQHLGYVQIDTISVVERAHHHTLYVRVPNYNREHLDRLQQNGRHIFEYWSHAAAFLPMEDYPHANYRMQIVANRKKGHWFPRNHKVLKYVKDKIKAEGPLMSKDFKLPNQKKSTPWWGWKPTKMALEQLFHEGELMISHRKGFQKVYNLSERILPSHISTTPSTQPEYCTYLIRQGIRSAGFVKEEEARYLRSKFQKPTQQAIQQLLDSNEIIPFTIKGLEDTYYTTSQLLEQLPKRIGKKRVHLLCPFDNAIIQRKRVISLFNFDYKLECYVPAPKRKFGYFSLAVLFGDAFAGHLDLKLDRKTKQLHIKQFTLDPNFKLTDRFLTAFLETLNRYADYNGAAHLKENQVKQSIR